MNRLLLGCLVILGLAAPATAQVTKFSEDVNTAIDRGLQWLDSQGYFNGGTAGDSAGLVAVALLEKRSSAAQNASGLGYSGASAADKLKLDSVIGYLIDSANLTFHAYRNGQEMMALALYLRTGGPRQADALAALNTAFDEAVKQTAFQTVQVQVCGWGCWWESRTQITGSYPTQAQVNAWSGYWYYTDGWSKRDSSTTQFVISGLAAARGVYADATLGDATRLAVLDMVTARSAAAYAASGVPGAPVLSNTEKGHPYTWGECSNINSLAQTASGTWIQVVGGSTIQSAGVQAYLEWLRNRYQYTGLEEYYGCDAAWRAFYGYYLWSFSKALSFLDDAGLAPLSGGLSSADLGVLPANASGPKREAHLDPATVSRPATFGAGGAGYYADPREPARWYFDMAYTLLSRQTAAGHFPQPYQDYWGQGAVAQAYQILVLQRSVGGGCLDADGDGECDSDDNCPQIANANQADGDSDGIGDACDACVTDPDNDGDHDGTCAEDDVCPNDPQNDADQDGVCGDVDACPLDAQNDIDQDGVCGNVDNCPTTANPDQADANGINDGDGVGDACENQPPVAHGQFVTTPEDTAVSITLGAGDPDGNPLAFTVVSGPQHGTLSGAAPNLTYTPNANYFGPDSFTFQVNDGLVDSNVATVSIDIIAVNDPPVADPGVNQTTEDTPVDGQVSSSDLDGLAPTYSVVASASHGLVQMASDGSYTYTPAPNYNGPDSFTFRAFDGQAYSNVATVDIVVAPVNDAPVAYPDAKTTDEDVPVNVVLTGSDVDGNALTYTVVVGPQHGSLSGSAPNLVYTPSLNYNGPDSFTFKVNDGALDSNIATVSINVRPVNDAPVCTLTPSVSQIWPPNHKMVPVTVSGATDVEGDTVTMTVKAIAQDEPTNTVGDGNTPSDGSGLGTSTALVRAERSGSPKVPGNGRVYHIFFSGSDGNGGSCDGKVTVGVPHDQGQRRIPQDDGAKVNSVTGGPF